MGKGTKNDENGYKPFKECKNIAYDGFIINEAFWM